MSTWTRFRIRSDGLSIAANERPRDVPPGVVALLRIGLVPPAAAGTGEELVEPTVQPEVVVLEAPLLDEYLRLEQRVEALTVEALVPELAVKRLDVAILPGAARLDEERLHGHALEPVRHGLGGELGAVVRADVGGNSAPHEALGEAGALLDGGEPSGNDDCEALARVLIDDHEELQRSPIGSALEDEVVGADVIGSLCTPAHDGAVRQPESSPLGLLPRYPQPLLAPESLYPFVVHRPSLLAQQRRDAAIAVTSEA